MANNPIEMRQLRTVLRLFKDGHSKRSIAHICGLSKNTVKKYLSLFKELKMDPEELEAMDDQALSELFTRTVRERNNPKLQTLQEFFPYVHKELRRTGVTRTLLWQEYKELHPDGYGLTQFCVYYKRWSKRVDPSMHVEYKAGDKLLIDYAGKKLSVVDPSTGEIKEVEVFVAVLGASKMIYCDVSESQKKEDLIPSVEGAMHYFEGAPRAIVPDNLKSAVTKSDRYEPRLNPDFEDFAEHYGTAVLPTRVYRPKDKAMVEGAVKIIYREVHAKFRNEVFQSIEELNRAVRSQLQVINERKLTGRPYGRIELFREVERDALIPLPRRRFELRTYLQATVLQNGHVCLQPDKHYYSVPYTYIRKKVKIAYTTDEVRIYHRYERIATHKRVKSPYNYTTEPDHLASQHREYTKWNADYFLEWARSIAPDVEQLIREILERKKHPEQAYRSCVGVLGLKKKVGRDRLVSACTHALQYGRHSYKAVQDILERGIDHLEITTEERPLPSHENIRGSAYYNDENANER